MHSLIFTLRDIFDKPFYFDFNFWVSLITFFAFIATIIIAIVNNNKIKYQIKIENRPFLSIGNNVTTDDKTHSIVNSGYIVFNPSDKIALNIVFISKKDDRYKILKDNYVIGLLPPYDPSKYGNNASKIIDNTSLIDVTKDIVLGKMSFLRIFINYFEDKKENYQAIIYEDLFGEKIYTIAYVSSNTLGYDEFFETKYLRELK